MSKLTPPDWWSNITKPGRYSPGARKKDAPRQLVTEYGMVHDNDQLEYLDEQEFLKWTKEYREKNDIVPETRSQWIILYKHTLAEQYSAHWFDLSEKL
jgi:hypothetical protein